MIEAVSGAVTALNGILLVAFVQLWMHEVRKRKRYGSGGFRVAVMDRHHNALMTSPIDLAYAAAYGVIRVSGRASMDGEISQIFIYNADSVTGSLPVDITHQSAGTRVVKGQKVKVSRCSPQFQISLVDREGSAVMVRDPETQEVEFHLEPS